jgi:hypothetical protein
MSKVFLAFVRVVGISLRGELRISAVWLESTYPLGRSIKVNRGA